jgi:hypothetical protein
VQVRPKSKGDRSERRCCRSRDPRCPHDSGVEVHFRDGRIAKLPVNDQLFCVDRLWDQRAEAGYMKKIEDEFQWLVDELEAGRSGPLSSDEHRCVTRFWGLWYWRNRFIDSPLEDTSLNGIAGESLTVDQKEVKASDNLGVNLLTDVRSTGYAQASVCVSIACRKDLIRGRSCAGRTER